MPSYRPRSKKPNSDETDPTTRLAINAVEKVFLRDFKWSFRRLPGSSIGVDARVDILDEGSPTGRFLALQIRSMPSREENGGDYIYRGENNHLDYWTKHSLPVYLVVVDLESGLMLWQRVEKWLCEETETGWSIAVPVTNVLDASARLGFDEAIVSDPESLMRSAFALDRALMVDVQDQTTFFVWDEWINTTRPFRSLRIYFGDCRQAEPDLVIDCHLCADNLHDVMTRLFPWATYSYAEPISEYSEEIAVHILDVELRPEAHAYLEIEGFFEARYPEDGEPLPPEAYDFISGSEEREFWRALLDRKTK